MLKFYLGDNTLVRQPQGFGGLLYKKVRSAFWGGFMYDTFGYVEGLKDLTFTEPLAVDFIKNELEFNGILAKIPFRVVCGTPLGGQKQMFSGLVDISTLKWVDCCQVKVSLKDFSQQNKIDSRGDIAFTVEPDVLTKFHAKYLNLNENIQDSFGYGLYVKDAFSQLVRKISDGGLGFKSDFFETGLGKDDVLTSGENIRGLQKPLNATLEGLFDGLHKIYRLEGCIEGNTLRIEKKDSQKKITYLGNVVRYTQDVNTGQIFSGIKVGFEKWQAEGKYKDDEFNSQRQYVTEGVMGKNELNLVSKLITSGYLIEETRRVQFDAAKKDAEWKYDNDLFLIATRKTGGIVAAQRNEDWSNITDVEDPKSLYNLKYSPARMLWHWQEELGSCGIVSMESSVGNSKMAAYGKNDGVGVYLSENYSKSFGDKIPYVSTFEKNIAWEDFDGLGDWVEYDACGESKIGRIEDVEWKMVGAGERGTAKFTVKEY